MPGHQSNTAAPIMGWCLGKGEGGGVLECTGVVNVEEGGHFFAWFV